MTEDSELLHRYVQDGDETAFADLVQRHLGLVYHTALRHVSGDVHSAQDIAQSVFTELARRSRDLLRYPTLGGWLYAHARYASLDAARSRQRRHRREQQAQLMNETDSNHDAPLDWQRLRPVIDQAMDRLSDRDRNAVYLRYFEGRPFAEVAARFGLTEDGARKRVDRATDKLRRHLKGLGLTSATGAVALEIAGQVQGAVPIGLAESISAGAIAASGGPATGLVAILHLMSTTKIAIGSALTACVLLMGFSLHEQMAINHARAALEQEKTASEKAAQAWDELQRQSVPVSQSSSSSDMAAGGKASAATRRDQTRDLLSHHGLVPGTQRWQMTAVDRELVKDTEVQKLFRKYFTSDWNAVYGPLFAATGWSQAQIAALENLKLQQNNNVGSAVLTLRPDDVEPSQIRQSMQDLLGDSGYQQYLQYDRTVWAGGVVASSLAGNLYDSGEPLTASQATQLTQIVANSTGEGYSHASNINWSIALPEARAVLSSNQYAVLQTIATLMTANGGPTGGLSGLAAGGFGNGFLAPGLNLQVTLPAPPK